MGGRSTHFQASMGTSFDHHQVTYEYPDGRSIYGLLPDRGRCYGSNKDVFHGTKGRCHFAASTAPISPTSKAKYLARRCRVVEEVTLRAGTLRVSAVILGGGQPFQRAKTLADSPWRPCWPNGGLIRPEDHVKEALDSKFASRQTGEITMNTEPRVKPGARRDLPVARPRPNQSWYDACMDGVAGWPALTPGSTASACVS